MNGNESHFKEVKTKMILAGICSPEKNMNDFIDYLLKDRNRNTIFLINSIDIPDRLTHNSVFNMINHNFLLITK